MAKQRVFISFDYDNDEDIKKMLVGQSKLDDSPFEFKDNSVKAPLTGDWEEKVKRRLGNCDQMIVLCGNKTHTAKGVTAELKLAQELKLPYFLLWGRAKGHCTKPTSAKANDSIYEWTWPTLKSLIKGDR